MTARGWVVERSAGLEGDVLLLRVEQDGARRIVPPAASLAVVNHSPTGFETGYAGSGPTQLALAILLDFGLPAPRALAVYHELCREEIASRTLARGGEYYISRPYLEAWVRQKEATHRPQFDPSDCGGAFDGNRVTSDADGGL